MKFKNWDGNDLTGNWMITIKIDGIQGRLLEGNSRLLSKNDTLLNNLPKNLPSGSIFEVFNGDCGGTWSVLSGPEGERKRITQKQIFKLFPIIDPRLIVGKYVNPTAKQIKLLFDAMREVGHEGLVLRCLNKEVPFIKVKASYTIDTKVISVVEGKGRLKGKLGKFVTENGGVGVGLTDAQRAHFWRVKKLLIGTTIEVKCMELTKNNMFRHPRFVKLRPDK